MTDNANTTRMQAALRELQIEIHFRNLRWWQTRTPVHFGESAWRITPIKRNKGELLMLIVSEIAEAMEGERKGLMDDHLPHRKMAEVEIADAIIRLLDYGAGFGYDIAGALFEKLDYNDKREDHEREAQMRAEGKEW